MKNYNENKKQDFEEDDKEESGLLEEEIVEQLPLPLLEGIVSNCTKLRLRVTPSETADVVCLLDNGTVLLVSQEDHNDWSKVIVKDKPALEGYCMSKYITM